MNGQEFTVLPKAATVAMGMLIVGMFLTFIRLVRGPTVCDRVLALDTIGTLGMGVIIAHTMAARQAVFLDVAIVMALIVFLGTVAFARYLERRNQP